MNRGVPTGGVELEHRLLPQAIGSIERLHDKHDAVTMLQEQEVSTGAARDLAAASLQFGSGAIVMPSPRPIRRHWTNPMVPDRSARAWCGMDQWTNPVVEQSLKKGRKDIESDSSEASTNGPTNRELRTNKLAKIQKTQKIHRRPRSFNGNYQPVIEELNNQRNQRLKLTREGKETNARKDKQWVSGGWYAAKVSQGWWTWDHQNSPELILSLKGPDFFFCRKGSRVPGFF